MDTYFYIAAALFIPWLLVLSIALLGTVFELDWRNLDVYLWPRRGGGE